MLRRKAKRLGDSMEGLFMELKLYDLMPRVFADACIMDLGVLKVFRAGDALKVERCFTNHIFWDLDEALYAAPRSIFQKMETHKSALLHQFPEKAQAIEQATLDNSYSPDTEDEAQMVTCFEAWHLPTAPDANDGRHVICIDGATLHD